MTQASVKAILLIVLTLLMLPILACDQDTSPRQPTPSASPTSLQDTFESLRKWYADRSFALMRPYIDATHRENVIGLLIAVDELLAANDAALEAIRKACPSIQTQQYDMSALTDNLELFSRDVKLAGVRQEGDRGTIMVQISGRLPLEELEFKRLQDRWVYYPGQTGPEVIDLTRQITAALHQIIRVVSAGNKTEKEIESEYQLRIGSKLKRIRKVDKSNAE